VLLSTLFECLGFGAAVFVDEFGDEEDVVGARENGEGENGCVDGWQIVAGAVRDAGGEHDEADGEDLNGRVDFPKHRGPETTESGNDVDCSRADEDEDVATDYGYRYPKRYWKVRRQRLREY